jgi:hypothetical protein
VLTDDIKVIEREHKHFDVSVEKWAAPKPHGISGLFRLHNEEQFMEAAITSHINYLDQVVLVIQPSDDRTEELAYDLRSRARDTIKIVHYPFPLHPIGSEAQIAAPANSVYTLCHMTNWGIGQCDYSWIAKIEGDVIGLLPFENIREAVDAEPDAMRYYGRVGLNLAGEKADQFSFTSPRTAGWDEAVFNNHPTFHCVQGGKWETLNLHDDPALLRNMGWSFLHLKRSKVGAQPGIERWTAFNPENLQRALIEYNSLHPFPGLDNPVGEPCLFERNYLE